MSLDIVDQADCIIDDTMNLRRIFIVYDSCGQKEVKGMKVFIFKNALNR